MTFDSSLFASRTMFAKEAHTCSFVRDLIVAAKGVLDDQWEGTYGKATGSILNICSKLGELVHMTATCAVKLWKEFDIVVFNLLKGKHMAWLAEHRSNVFAKLKKDFKKLWFRWKMKEGQHGCQRPYRDNLQRGHSPHGSPHVRCSSRRWVYLLHNLAGDWFCRVKERSAGVNNGNKALILQS